MYAKSRINLYSVIVLILCASTFAYAQTATPDQTITATPNQSITGTATATAGPGSNAGTAGITLPSACPAGAASCPGTALCIDGKVNEGPDVNKRCTPTASGSLLRDGIFGCSASKYQNVGSLSAVGGIYVPVNDAAVTLNTGYLVYKECVLDGVVSAIKNDAVAGLQKQVLNAAERGRNGNAQYLKSFESDLRPGFDAIVINVVNEAKSGSMCGAFKGRVETAYARNYYESTRTPSSAVSCAFASDAARAAYVSRAAPVNWGTWNNLIEPPNYELGQYNIIKSRSEAAIATHNTNVREMLNWGRGMFPVFDNDDPLTQKVITPGFILADTLSKMIGAGTDILLNANEIDQVNGALQAGLSSVIVTDSIRGLSGLMSAQNGQPSYIDRMASEASASVRTGAINAAISILSPARQIETLFKQSKEAIATALTNAIAKLRAAETQCWGLMVPKVREFATQQNCGTTGDSGATSCTPVPLDERKIAASTSTPSFSQPIINREIAPVASTTINDIRASEAALTQINQLIALVTTSSSAVNQRTAIERLDTMVANNQLHSAQQATNAQKTRDEVIAATNILVDDTLKAWGDSTDPNIGWCNINNNDAVVMWFNRWKQ